MKITVEITEADAARLWHNYTPTTKATLTAVLERVLREDAQEHRAIFPERSDAQQVASFRNSGYHPDYPAQ